ncbi:outer membrane permeability protein SanA [Halomonas shantousis]
MWRVLKRLLLALFGALLTLCLIVVALNVWVLAKTHSRIEHDLPLCVAEPVGLVFGTARGLRGGGRNPYFSARIMAAARLLRLQRVQHLLLSGDNRTRFYNEPITMWRDLRGHNVPKGAMTLDYAGFSTFDSIVRAKEVFGVRRVLLISQAWHLPRALFIADAMGIEAYGCAAPGEPATGAWQLWLREWLARAATVGDLYLWGRKPYFLGPFEPLPLREPTSRLSDSA